MGRIAFAASVFIAVAAGVVAVAVAFAADVGEDTRQGRHVCAGGVWSLSERRDQSYAYIRKTGRTFSTLRHTLKYWGVSNTSPPRK